MTRETLQFLSWLVQQQTLSLGDPNARSLAASAFLALDEIGAALGALDEPC